LHFSLHCILSLKIIFFPFPPPHFPPFFLRNFLPTFVGEKGEKRQETDGEEGARVLGAYAGGDV
jgi:hypothetical protein